MSYSISKPVGPWEDGVVRQKNGNRLGDIKTVQKLLISASKELDEEPLNPGVPDGKIARAPRKSNTLNAIFAFQRRFLTKPDRRVDVGGKTWKQLLKYAEEIRPKVLSIHSGRLIDFCQAMMDGHCRYGFGKKASPLNASPESVTEIDCSGFVRYLLYQVSNGSIVIPDGSWNQDAWFRRNRFLQVGYEEAQKQDGALRLGYFSGSPGHIWFIRNGKTIESRGRHGPSRRRWDTGVLKRNVQRCFLVSRLPARLETGIPA